ncbi:MAG: M20/M25/M40 family metallo-hydrolase, partial [Planctomycetales bacterium]|nr:M20/M25/M40 family metallo-hydrolase [Planctomycetales bacterium]
QELAVSQFVQQTLIDAGAKADQFATDKAHQRSVLKGQTGNLVWRLPGTKSGDRRMLMAHLDTVPICVGCQPVRRGQFISSRDPHTGLGADDRAGTAVLLQTALRLLREDLPHPPLTFLWTVQEEIGLHGARNLSLGMLGKPRMAFNWDGGAANKLTIGATGGYRFEITIHGKASHAGGAPERGISAIAVAAKAIARLHDGGWHGLIQQPGGNGTSNVGVIQGGAATNVVTDCVRVRAEARSHDPQFRQQIIAQIEREFRDAAASVKNVDGQAATVEISGRLDYESFQLAPQDPPVQAASAAVVACDLQPELAITNGGLDANWLSARGIPTVTLGCGQLGQHTVDEQLDLEQFHAACRIAWKLATNSD